MAKPQLSLKGRALRYLSMREHSRLELGRKLARYATEDDDVEAVLDFLEAAKFLSQSRFSEALVHRRAARFGNSRILSELQSHGIQGEDLAGVKASLSDGEIARAREVWQRKMRFMQQRGFSHKAIRAAMSGQSEEFE
jgi:regulatory protein